LCYSFSPTRRSSDLYLFTRKYSSRDKVFWQTAFPEPVILLCGCRISRQERKIFHESIYHITPSPLTSFCQHLSTFPALSILFSRSEEHTSELQSRFD